MGIKTTHTISNSISYDMGADGKTTTSVKDANGHVNKEVTNEAGLTESTTDLGDGEEQITTAYSYDTNGNKIRETYADGGYKTFDYDRKNRLIKTESYEAARDAAYYQVRFSWWICLPRSTSTPFNHLFRQMAALSLLRLHITPGGSNGILTVSAIGIALRLSLRTRLTLIRLALIRKP